MTEENDKLSSRERQLAGLKEHAWKPGQSGNPKGRPPKTKYLSEAARDLLSAKEASVEILQDDGTTKVENLQTDKNFAYAVMLAQLRKALQGDTIAAKELGDRAEGKPAAKIEIDALIEARLQEMRAPQVLLIGRDEVVHLPDDGIIRQLICREKSEFGGPPPTGRIVYCDLYSGQPTGREDRAAYGIEPMLIEGATPIPDGTEYEYEEPGEEEKLIPVEVRELKKPTA